jgi:hypothetical protein
MVLKDWYLTGVTRRRDKFVYSASVGSYNLYSMPFLDVTKSRTPFPIISSTLMLSLLCPERCSVILAPGNKGLDKIGAALSSPFLLRRTTSCSAARGLSQCLMKLRGRRFTSECCRRIQAPTGSPQQSHAVIAQDQARAGRDLLGDYH